MEERELTYGQKAVGLTFNPGNNPDVDNIKRIYADIIKRIYADIIDDMDDIRNTSVSAEQRRLASIAITEAQTAQMWAVKAATWKD